MKQLKELTTTTKPTADEIAEEIRVLQVMAPLIPQRSFFGDDNRRTIDAQIAILAGTRHLSYFEVDETCEDFEDSDLDLYTTAQEALMWRDRGDGEAPSKGWANLVPGVVL